MNLRRTALALAVIAIVTASYAIPRLQDAPSSTPGHMPDPAIRSPKQVVEIFLKAVDRGELILFVYTLNRSLLIPRRVEYDYELDSMVPTVTVYSELKEAIPVPDQPGLEVRDVSAILGRDGSIIETRAHVYGRTDAREPDEQ
jgi:hypothetical protein